MGTYYDGKNKRLLHFGKSADQDFWDRHWKTNDYKKIMERSKNDQFVLKTLNKYIPDKGGIILEGGCGRSQIVYCMHANGYKTIGIDFAEKTVKKCKEAMPDLDIRIGDVKSLNFADSYFKGYWSLGVIEHFFEGYEDIINEIKRVLVNDGYLFLTFPNMSSLRKLKAKLGLYKDFDGQTRDNFYQFILDPEIVINDFNELGFELLEKKSLGGIKGFKDEFKIFKPFLQKLNDYNGNNIWIIGFRYLLDRSLTLLAGHTIFMVFKNIK